MVCESWKAKLDTYLDGEVPEKEMRTFDAHVRNCPSCSADALTRVQMKRAIQVAGKRFTPSAEFRKRMQQSMAPMATLASSSPVDVISTDRHTVKPWFQGKIPFAFNLPELQNSEFSLLGGRMTYLEQTPASRLRRAETPYFRVRFPRTITASQVGRKFSLAEETAVQHGNVESRRPSLFRDRRRECSGHR